MKFYQVDSFTNELFKGNPAGVCIVENTEMNEFLMLKIAAENNLSETAFVFRDGEDYEIRWFTPGCEVSLCGHATLAAAHILFMHEGFTDDKILFNSKSGLLIVEKSSRSDYQYTMNFPLRQDFEEIIFTEGLDFFGIMPIKLFKCGIDFLFVFEKEDDVKRLKADLDKIMRVCLGMVVVTASAETCDYVYRVFAPSEGINEDPVTGSAQTLLMPYWKSAAKKSVFVSMQVSQRTGKLLCEAIDNRVLISGNAVTFSIGRLCL